MHFSKSIAKKFCAAAALAAACTPFATAAVADAAPSAPVKQDITYTVCQQGAGSLSTWGYLYNVTLPDNAPAPNNGSILPPNAIGPLGTPGGTVYQCDPYQQAPAMQLLP